MSRQPVALGLLFALGALLVAAGLVDIYQDWAMEGNRLWTTLAENLLPLAVAGGVVTLGWRWSRLKEGKVYVTEAARWTLASSAGMAVLCAIVLGLQVVQGRLKPTLILAQMGTFGAGAGLLIGYVVAQMRETRRELRRHRDLLRRTQEVAKVGGWEYDPAADRAEGTGEFNRILGLPDEESFDLERGLQFYPPGSRDRVRKNVSECLQEGEPFDLELPLTREASSQQWARLRGERKRRREGSIFLTGTLQDITEQKEMERVLREEQSVLRRMYRITADRDQPFDEKVEKLIDLGRSYLDLPYGHVARISDDTQEIKHARGEHPMISPGDSCPLSQSYCRKTIEQGGLLAVQNAPEEGWDGDPAYEAFGLGSYIGSKIRVGGDIYGTFCFSADEARPRPFTDREKTFVELLTLWASYEIGRNRATRQLKAQNERLDRFASVLSHDLRNPLNVAQGRLQLAKDDNKNREDHLSSVEGALERMNEIIQDMLLLTWSEQEIDPEDLGPVDVEAAAREAWAHVDAPEATLEVEASARLRGHEGRLRRLLENLFRNAVEHGSEAVSLTVGSLRDEQSSSNGTSSSGGFFVEDDGPGIPEEKRGAVLEGGYSSRDEGTGLGLSIVQGIAEAHGWSVSVTAGREGGARFEFRGAEVPGG